MNFSYIAILIGYVAVTSAAKRDEFKVPEERLIRIRNIANQCAVDNNLDTGLFTRIVDGTLPRDDATNKYAECFAVKTGLVDEIGHINIDKLAGLLGNHPRVGEFREAMRKCNEVTKENRIATVVAMNQCYGDTTPVLFVF